jgi:hypothetical protein
VTYTVSNPDNAPETLNFGPPFFTLAADCEISVIIGLNRRLDNLSITIDAATLAKSKIGNLYSIELGNEPECKLLTFLDLLECLLIVYSLQQQRPYRRGRQLDGFGRLLV